MSTSGRRDKLHAGTATETIALDPGVQLSGYGVEDRSMTEIHDPLLVQALVMSVEGNAIAIVSLDLLNVYQGLSNRVRQRINERDVEIDEILLAATHTHAGPYIPATSLEINPNHRMDTDEATIETIERAVADAVTAAHEGLEPAVLGVGKTENDTTAINRRANGGVVGSIRMPRGKIDPELTVIRIETEPGEETILFHYACHPVCTTSKETLASADWPGYARKKVAERQDATVIFLNGAAGDINPRDWPSDPDEGEAVYEYMDELGSEVADSVEEALEEARDGPEWASPPIFTDRRDLRLPTKDVGPVAALEEHLEALGEEITQLEEAGDEAGLAARRADRGYVEELLAIARSDIPRLSAPMPYLEIGGVGLLGMPGEVFAEHGLDFKAEASVETLLPVGYANEYVGYLPTLKELENIDYEVRTMKVAPEAISKFRTAGFELVSD